MAAQADSTTIGAAVDRTVRIRIDGANDLLEDAVCLLGYIEIVATADLDNDTAQRTARMAVQKIREAQSALNEGKARR